MLKGLLEARITREEKDLPKQTQNNYENANRNIYINKYFIVNGSSTPTKINRLAKRIQKQDLYTCYL